MSDTEQAAVDASHDFAEDILVVEESGGTTHFLLVTYAPGNAANAAGYVFRRPAGSDEPAQNLLATNDTLRMLWTSPRGSVWATSTTGLVWTSATVTWPVLDVPDLEFDAPEGDLDWHFVALPAQEHNGARPNPMAIWGSADDDVHVGTFGGVLYHWNGSAWSQFFPGIGQPIGCIRGRSRHDVYAVGYGSTLLHFDGSAWTRVADPDGPGTSDILTGIAFEENGDVLVCGKSRGGRLLRGSVARGFVVDGRHDLPLMGLARVGGRLFFAAAKQGVVEWTPSGPKVLRDHLIPWTIAEGDGRIYVTETPGEAVYSELDLTTGAWRRVSY